MQTKILNPRKEIITNILDSEPTERIGIFDLDIELYPDCAHGGKITECGSLKISDKFFAYAFEGPFQSLSKKYGLQEALIRFVQQPRQVHSFFKDYLEKMNRQKDQLIEEGYRFDGAWMWEDIAYEKGLYFSTDKYRNTLSSIHREAVDMFASNGLKLFFHCDGNIENLIPLLANMGIKAFHPMQESCNPHLLRIKDIFKDVITFVGGVGIHRLNQPKQELFDYIDMLSGNGNYIFCFDAPLGDSNDKSGYEELLKEIESSKEAAGYGNRDN